MCLKPSVPWDRVIGVASATDHGIYQRLDASGGPSLKVRKRLALRSGNICAFTGCTKRLEQGASKSGQGTILGEECHIVAKRDDPGVARAPCLLTEQERIKWAMLIESRHGFENLVLMCREHAVLIDDVAQGFSVSDIVDMKLAHEALIEAKRKETVTTIDTEGGSPGPAPSSRLILLDDIGEWQRKAMKALAEVDVEAFGWLQNRLSSNEPYGVQALIQEWPIELIEGPNELVVAVIREAEAKGLWPEATKAWMKHAERATESETRADRLVRAAIDADVGGDTELREELLQEAEGLDPECVRLKLVQLDDSLAPGEQLESLDELDTDDPALASLIAAQRSLNFLLLAEIDGAEAALSEAAKLEPDSIAVGIARINLEVQKARLALTGDRPFVMADVLKARDDSLDLRRKLVDMKRFEESSRLLMLAADVMAVLQDREAAQVLLERAVPEEFESAPSGAEVLGDAALRVAAPELALRFTEHATETDSIVRIRATAEVDLPGPQRKSALERLEELAEAGGPESEYAAASRLIACLPPVEAEWSEYAASVLAQGPHHLMATKLRILTMTRIDPEGAKRLALEQPAEAWAAELRLRVGGLIEDTTLMKEAASEFYGHGPDAAGLLLISKGFAKIGDLERAGDTLVGLVHDPNSPPQVRSDAYDTLMSTLADRDSWGEARKIWTEWADFATKECRTAFPRISAWQVRVAHNDRPATD